MTRVLLVTGSRSLADDPAAERWARGLIREALDGVGLLIVGDAPWPVASQRPAGCICDFRDRKHRFSCLRQQPTVAVTRDEGGAFRVAGTEVDRGE